jgi:hypothetical protein
VKESTRSIEHRQQKRQTTNKRQDTHDRKGRITEYIPLCHLICHRSQLKTIDINILIFGMTANSSNNQTSITAPSALNVYKKVAIIRGSDDVLTYEDGEGNFKSVTDLHLAAVATVSRFYYTKQHCGMN